MDYAAFLDMQEKLEVKARAAARAHLEIYNRGDYSLADVYFYKDSIGVRWEWEGPYQAYDSGLIDVPVWALDDPARWERYVRSEKEVAELKAAEEKAEEDKRRVEERIAEAKKVLRQAGITQL